MDRIQRSYEALGDEGLRRLCRELAHDKTQLTSTVELDLGGNQLTKASGEPLAQLLSILPNLEELDLRDNKLREGIRALVAVFPLRLQRLDLNGNYIRDYGVQCLEPWLINIGTLAELELTDNQIGVAGAMALAQALQANNSLTRLSLAFNVLGDDGAAALARGMMRNRSLCSVDLSDNTIGDEGSKALAGVISNSSCQLALLNLAVNRIEQVGAQALSSALEKNETLTHLDMGCNPIGSPGATAFAAALIRNETLRTLDLSTCHLDNECAPVLLKALSHNSTLTDLGLLCNQEMDISLMEPIFEKFRHNREIFEARGGAAATKKSAKRKWLLVGGIGVGICVLAVGIGITVAVVRRKR